MAEDNVDIFKQVAIDAVKWDRRFANYFEQQTKTGLPLIENDHDLQVLPESMKTKPVKIGEIPADVSLNGYRHESELDTGMKAVAFDEEGKLVNGIGEDFRSKGMYSISFTGHIPETYGFIPPQGIEQPPIGAKVWIEGGGSLLLPFRKDIAHGSKLATFTVGFNGQNRQLYMLPDANLIKKMRIGFYEKVEGGDTKV